MDGFVEVLDVLECSPNLDVKDLPYTSHNAPNDCSMSASLSQLFVVGNGLFNYPPFLLTFGGLSGRLLPSPEGFLRAGHGAVVVANSSTRPDVAKSWSGNM